MAREEGLTPFLRVHARPAAAPRTLDSFVKMPRVMSDPPPPKRVPPFVLWSPSQRGVLIAFVLILSTILVIRLARDRMYVSKPPPTRGERYDDLASRIDPNTATWQELAVLPVIGEKRAKDIVAYRDAYVARQSNSLPFAGPQDLMQVKGIGPAMIETLRSHLAFPTTHATQPVAEISAESQNRPPPGP